MQLNIANFNSRKYDIEPAPLAQILSGLEG